MAKFRNANGDVIETDSPAEINDYRQRAGFEEVGGKSASKKTAKKSDSDS